MIRFFVFFLALVAASPVLAQHRCQFHAQHPQSVTVMQGRVLDREVEIDFTNTGVSTWQRTGGVSNLNYIELRPCTSSGSLIEGPLYHSAWINRQRVGSFIAAQNGVAPGQTARFVFRIRADGSRLSVGTHHFYFRPYHAAGGYINNWGQTRITVIVTAPPGPAPQPSPVPTPSPSPQPTPSPPPAPQPTPAPTLQARMTRVQVPVIRTRSGSGAYTEQHNLLSSPLPIRQYQTLQLFGEAIGGSAIGFEWSLVQGQSSKILGTSSTITTNPEDLYLGNQTLRLRVRDSQSRWSQHVTTTIDVRYWPRLRLPVHGNWVRNGYDYNEGDHRGAHLWAEDWNHPIPGDTDFGLEIVASLDGVVTVEESQVSGKIVYIEYQDGSHRFRTRSYHLSTVLVQTGQTVHQGQPIGLCGDTGSSSQGSHLHYVLERWQNGAWQPVAPYPVWITSTRVQQTVDYRERVTSENRSLGSNIIILDEGNATAPHNDINGWGRSKRWAPTTNSISPSASCLWDFTVPASGRWKVWMHNPSARTNSLAGLSTHNTTNNAVFEITRTGGVGIETFHVDQGGSPKGALVLIAEFDLQGGDRVSIRQHNATGEASREISFDQLMLTLEQPSGSGGGSGPTSGPIPSSSPGGVTTSSPPQNSPPSPGGSGSSTSPTTSSTAYGGGGGSGGCSMAPTGGSTGLGAFCLLIISTLLLLGRRLTV